MQTVMEGGKYLTSAPRFKQEGLAGSHQAFPLIFHSARWFHNWGAGKQFSEGRNDRKGKKERKKERKKKQIAIERGQIGTYKSTLNMSVSREIWTIFFLHTRRAGDRKDKWLLSGDSINQVMVWKQRLLLQAKSNALPTVPSATDRLYHALQESILKRLKISISTRYNPIMKSPWILLVWQSPNLYLVH